MAFFCCVPIFNYSGELRNFSFHAPRWPKISIKKKTRLSVSEHGWLTWIRFQLQWKMRFRKGGRYRRSEVEGLPTTPIVVLRSVSRSYVTLSVSRSYVTRLFKVDTNFKNVFTLKKKRKKGRKGAIFFFFVRLHPSLPIYKSAAVASLVNWLAGGDVIFRRCTPLQ